MRSDRSVEASGGPERGSSGIESAARTLRRNRCLALGVTLTAASLWLAPVGLTAPPAQVPVAPVLGEACNDQNKLAYDPELGQIICTQMGWVRSVEPTGIRNMGEPCAASEMTNMMASSPDGHLIWCPSHEGVWVLYRP